MKPRVTIALAAFSLAATAARFLAIDALDFDRGRIAGGEAWRLLTGHFVHGSGEQLFYNAATFALLGALCERISRRGFVATTLVAAAAVSTAVWFAAPEVAVYQGLSGVAAGAFLFLLVSLARSPDRASDPSRLSLKRWILPTAGAAFLCKLAFEAATGEAVFVADLGPDGAPLVCAHVAGAAAGAVVALACNARGARGRDRAPLFVPAGRSSSGDRRAGHFTSMPVPRAVSM